VAADGSVARDFVVNLAATAAWALLVWLVSTLRRIAGARRPVLRTLLLALASLFFVGFNIGVRYYYTAFGNAFLFISTSILVSGWWLEIRQFWLLGIVGVGSDPTSDSRYDRALQLCRNSLDFVGIGARKLTDRRVAFDAAMTRCHRDNRPIRFLLCAPSNARLIQMALQAGRPANEYQENVRASLRILKLFREERARNIEVRFYDELPVFRLMFINDDICLASHYVFGEGDGSRLPDVYIKRYAGKRDVDSIYYGFRRYFEQLWDRSHIWDFSSDLT
jgi:hypothetical protein